MLKFLRWNIPEDGDVLFTRLPGLACFLTNLILIPIFLVVSVFRVGIPETGQLFASWWYDWETANPHIFKARMWVVLYTEDLDKTLKYKVVEAQNSHRARLKVSWSGFDISVKHIQQGDNVNEAFTVYNYLQWNRKIAPAP